MALSRYVAGRQGRTQVCFEEPVETIKIRDSMRNKNHEMAGTSGILGTTSEIMGTRYFVLSIRACFLLGNNRGQQGDKEARRERQEEATGGQ